MLPLYPGHGLFLLVYTGDGERFAKLFRRTWRRIAKQDRDLLLSRWNSEREIVRRRMPKRIWSAIALRRQHHKFDESQEKRRITFGCAGPGGMSSHEPTFWIMPDRVFSIVIAHELAPSTKHQEALVRPTKPTKPRLTNECPSGGFTSKVLSNGASITGGYWTRHTGSRALGSHRLVKHRRKSIAIGSILGGMNWVRRFAGP